MVSPRENFLLAVNHKEPYWLPCPLFDGSAISIQHGLIERRSSGLDDWGVRWELKDQRSDSFPTCHPLESPDMVDDYPMPSPYEPKIIEKALESASKADRENAILIGDNGWGLFERAWLLLGMARFFLWAFHHQDALKRLIERIAEVKIALTEVLIRRAGVDAIWYGDDWGMEDRLLMSPETWREIIKPYQAKLYWAAKKHGVLVIQHSDGKIEDIIPDLIEIGVDILNIQRECNDWQRITQKYGDQITLWGGVSARTLDIGSPKEIIKEVEECCQLGKHGGIILAPGQSLKYPPEKINVMFKTWMKKGHYKKPD